jgi:hypothetical protein
MVQPPLHLRLASPACSLNLSLCFARGAGTNPVSPIYLSVRGRVYDVSSAENFYGPSGGYAQLSGREASRVLAKMDFSQVDVSGCCVTHCARFRVVSTEWWTAWGLSGLRLCVQIAKWDDLEEGEAETLNEWVTKFDAKYPLVGRYKLTGADVPPATAAGAADAKEGECSLQ